MAVPKKRTSLSRKKMRRAHDFLSHTCVSKCANCGSLKKSHHMCDACGHYRGRAFLTPSVSEGTAET